jgi:hypothetical protein
MPDSVARYPIGVCPAVSMKISIGQQPVSHNRHKALNAANRAGYAAGVCCNKAARYDVRNNMNDRKLDEDAQSGSGPSAQTPALPAGCEPDVRALVCGLSAEPAEPGKNDG